MRLPAEIAAEPWLIPGSSWFDPGAFLADALPPALPAVSSHGAVLICQKGGKRSQGAAALLGTARHRAWVLEGGTDAWQAAGLPTVPQEAVPPTRRWLHTGDFAMRAAAFWLLRRFVTPAATPMCLPTETADDIATRFAAVLYELTALGLSPSQAAKFVAHPPLELLRGVSVLYGDTRAGLEAGLPVLDAA